MHAHSKKGTVAVFNAIGSDTWIDVGKKDDGTETHWISESGILDVFILPGPDPASVFSQYAGLTGTPMLPPLYSLAYHQCRWNYVSSEDIRSVQKRFDEEDIPVDVFWLDIEYAEGHKYFMWDEKTFPDPVEMIADVEAKERKVRLFVSRCLWMGYDGAHRWLSSSIPILNESPIIPSTNLHLISACLSSPSQERVNTKGMSPFSYSSSLRQLPT